MAHIQPRAGVYIGQSVQGQPGLDIGRDATAGFDNHRTEQPVTASMITTSRLYLESRPWNLTTDIAMVEEISEALRHILASRYGLDTGGGSDDQAGHPNRTEFRDRSVPRRTLRS